LRPSYPDGLHSIHACQSVIPRRSLPFSRKATSALPRFQPSPHASNWTAVDSHTSYVERSFSINIPCLLLSEISSGRRCVTAPVAANQSQSRRQRLLRIISTSAAGSGRLFLRSRITVSIQHHRVKRRRTGYRRAVHSVCRALPSPRRRHRLRRLVVGWWQEGSIGLPLVNAVAAGWTSPLAIVWPTDEARMSANWEGDLHELHVLTNPSWVCAPCSHPTRDRLQHRREDRTSVRYDHHTDSCAMPPLRCIDGKRKENIGNVQAREETAGREPGI